MTTQKLTQEFDRQSKNLIEKNYLELANISASQFNDYLKPLHSLLANYDLFDIDFNEGKLPFVIVVSSVMIPAEKAMERVIKNGKQGLTKLTPHTSNDFSPLSSITIPQSPIYLIVNIDRGKDTINITPEKALTTILEQKRTPLTIDEGIAIITHFSEFLLKNNCFSLCGSRHPGDQRVPALWINGQKHPNLGWCWDRNPHTWLGSASCQERLS